VGVSRPSVVEVWFRVSGVGSTTAAINFIATILAMRAPGMALHKVPFFVWTMLWTSVLIVFGSVRSGLRRRERDDEEPPEPTERPGQPDDAVPAPQ